jgi:hypothetical protein
MPAKRRSLHDDKAGTLEMAHDALRGYLGHEFVGVVFSLAPLEFQGEGDGVGEVVGIGRREFFRRDRASAHDNGGVERSKNEIDN